MTDTFQMKLTSKFWQGGYDYRTLQTDAVLFPVKFAIIVQKLIENLLSVVSNHMIKQSVYVT